MTKDTQVVIDAYVDRVFTVAQKKLDSGSFPVTGEFEGDKFIQDVSQHLITYAESYAKNVIVPEHDGEASAVSDEKLDSDVDNLITEQYEKFMANTAEAFNAVSGVSAPSAPSTPSSVPPHERIAAERGVLGDNVLFETVEPYTPQSYATEVAPVEAVEEVEVETPVEEAPVADTVEESSTPDESYADIHPEPGLDNAYYSASDGMEDNYSSREAADNEPDVPTEVIEYPSDSEIMHRVFTSVNYRTGYDTEDVYEFQQKLVRALRQLPLDVLHNTPDSELNDIEEVTLTPEMLREEHSKLEGVNFRQAYDMEEVDAFIEEQITALQERIDLLASRKEAYASRLAEERAERERVNWLRENAEKHQNEIIAVWDEAHEANEAFDQAIIMEAQRLEEEERARIQAEEDWAEEQVRSAQEERERLEREERELAEARELAHAEHEAREAEAAERASAQAAAEEQVKSILTVADIQDGMTRLREEDKTNIALSVTIGNATGGMYGVSEVSYDEGSSLVTVYAHEDGTEGISLVEVNSALNFIMGRLPEGTDSPMVVMRSQVGYHPVLKIDRDESGTALCLFVQ